MYIYFFDVSVLCACACIYISCDERKASGLIRNLHRRKEVKISKISAFLRKYLTFSRKQKDVFFKKQFTHAFFFVNTLTDEQSLRFPTNPRNAVWLFRRRGVVIASSPSRERTETFITREERTRCVLHIVVYVRRASRDEMRRGKATAQLPFFF